MANKIKNNKLNIVFLDFDDIKNPLLSAGQARATLEVGKRLVEMGHKITVLSSRFPGYKDRKGNGLYYKHIGLGTGNIRFNNLIYILTLPFYLRRIKGVDIVIECFTSPISTLFSPLWTRFPVVALPTSFEAGRFSKLYHLPFDKIEKFGLRFYKYFLPYTKHLDEKMKKVNPNVISKVVPEGVGDEFFKVKLNRPEYILFLGRLDIGQKGIDLLLKAYAKVKDKIKYPLIIAGNGPDEAKVKKLIEELGIGNKIKMVGPAYGKKKFELLSKALYVAFPSRHEGFSLFSLEALASGLPLVSFDIPALSWANETVTMKAKPFDVADYSKLLFFASHDKNVELLRKNARSYVKNYTWDSVASQFEAFFYFVIKNEQLAKSVKGVLSYEG